jgi:hypothetical protein
LQSPTLTQDATLRNCIAILGLVCVAGSGVDCECGLDTGTPTIPVCAAIIAIAYSKRPEAAAANIRSYANTYLTCLQI